MFLSNPGWLIYDRNKTVKTLDLEILMLGCALCASQDQYYSLPLNSMVSFEA